MRVIIAATAILAAVSVARAEDSPSSVRSYAPVESSVQRLASPAFRGVRKAEGWGGLTKPHRRAHRRFSSRAGVVARGTGLSGVVAPLAAWTKGTLAACPGARVISSVRRTRVAGTGRMSLHASGRAVDVQGNPSCVRARLAHWSGGASTDYWRVRHYHVSWGGGEHGLRFVHHVGRTRYAHRHGKRRYASTLRNDPE